jgi:stage V sporulation protein AD
VKLNRVGESTVIFRNKPRIASTYSIVGKKEADGPFRDYFDFILTDDLFGQKSYELAERQILEHAIFGAVDKGQIKIKDIDFMIGGDLLNQIISASFSARQFETPFIGLYGACSTMSESLAVGACLVDGGYARKTICATVSHFSTAERQYRFPLELGNQRPPVSQWTVTGAGCTILSNKGNGSYISMATFGKVTDYGINDANNMGAAMAPAAMETLVQHFKDTDSSPDDYDLIVTGDLGKLGSEILRDLMEHRGYKLGENYCDCGQMMYGRDQKVFQGGSGAGCSASIFNSYICKQLEKGVYKKVLFMATGALLSPVSTQQGETIPGIAHAVVIERGEE